MDTFTWTEDYGVNATFTPDVNSLQFGDGYEQRQANGINNNLGVYPVTFNNRTQDEGLAILAFLNNCGGVTTFLWTPPFGTDPIVVVCKSWTPTASEGNTISTSATFEQRIET